MNVTPTSANVIVQATQQFTATVTGTTNTTLSWSVNGIAGGSTTVGRISATGLYTAPAVIPTPAGVTITATSMADNKAVASSEVTVGPKAGIFIVVTPANVKVTANSRQQFTATVTGTANHSVNWFVDGHPGGNSVFGTISVTGLYTAPLAVPNPPTIAIIAQSAADTTKQGSVDLILQHLPIVLAVSPLNATVNLAATQQYTATITGTSNSAVTWKVNGVTGGAAATGTITAGGLYTAPAALPTPPTVTIEAVSNQDPSFKADSLTTIFNSNPLVSDAAAARFLEQSSWGPTIASVALVKAVGFSAYLDRQFAAPASAWPDLAQNDGIDVMQKRFWVNATTGQDQLRQRVAFALGEVMVISNHKIDPHGFPPYVRMLHQDAFSTYGMLLKDVTLSPVMGYYLDMVNNDKADPNNGTLPNENYAREIMQLFSIGLVKLNSDGSQQTDASANPIPTYTQDTIQGYAAVFTGWTYPTAPGKTKQIHNPQYWVGPMESNDSDHDMNPKAILDGVVLPAGQTAVEDLSQGLQAIVNDPSVGPFICLRLIQQLVTSNPTPAYMTRCSATFADNGSGQRGDLKAVVKEILLDSEARRGDDPTQLTASDGKLKEPILLITGLLRALNATTDGDSLNNYTSNMKEDLYNSPSVFNYFPPNYQLVSNNLLAPEMKIYTTPTALERANTINGIVFWNSPGGTKIDYTSWKTLASDNTKLLDALNAAMMHGSMPGQLRQSITTALNTLDPTDLNGRAKTAIYLIATSQWYSVQH
jgi:uncharacterized protein (DUF1800 family)